jgi:hypothetical protein
MAAITFQPMGRLGNWMMIASTAISYALKHGIPFSMPAETNSQYHNPVYYTHLNKLGFNPTNQIVIKEPDYFKYEDLPWNPSWKNADIKIVLKGFFQNLKYFQDYRSDIIDILDLPKEPISDRVAIHVRRGDYLNLTDKHIVPSQAWYEQAMRMFPNRSFVVFSDDINWCQGLWGNRKDVIFAAHTDELTAFKLLASCSDFINSSSTFSLMAAYLAPSKNKKVVTPSRWFTAQASNQWTQEIIPESWIKLASA